MVILRAGSNPLCVLRGFAVLLMVIAPTAKPDEVRVTMDQIIEQWKVREERVRRLHIEWNEVIGIPARSVVTPTPLGYGEFGATEDSDELRVSDKSVSVSGSVSLWLSGEMARFDAEYDSSGIAEKLSLPVSIAAASTGMYVTHLIEREHPVCRISRRADIPEFSEIPQRPVVMLWRSGLLRKQGTLNLEAFKIVDPLGPDDQDLLTITNRHGDDVDYLDIDLAADESLVPARVRRYIKDQDGRGERLSYMIFITYAASSDLIQIPAEWHIEMYADRVNPYVYRVIDAKVTKCDLNPVIPEGLFDIKYPPGTRVQNRVTNEDYILRKDGSKRAVTIAEKASEVTYQMLLDTESGMAAPGLAAAQNNAKKNSRVQLVILVVTMVCLAIFIMLRRNRLVGK